ncbi:hypothetical protein NPIL_320161 [Nephila pilipes]|uniref:Uncharacterized protein n=1 Tax=Nephila pilipes TaxID=299642 RepID=A0A8X6N624_NEPPI|nr:hypothetical protein NPIL_320161 [Nephila pilipes]
MKLLWLLVLFLATLVVLCNGTENATKPTRKTLRTVKALKKKPLSSRTTKAKKKSSDQEKSASQKRSD